MKAAIYSQKKDLDTFLYLSKFISELNKRGVKAIIYEQLFKDLEFSKEFSTFSNYEDVKQEKIDFFFSFGGDGTILNALNFIKELEIPIIGVNTGRLGFLASFSKEEIFSHIDEIITKEMNLSKRSVLHVTSSDTPIDFPYALNDLSVSRNETTSMITIETHINEQFLTYYWGDGLIISTPTGSTAYSLSCGGPIISPGNGILSLTPIAPHNLNVRPIVLRDDIEITLKVESRVPQYSLSLDSRLYHMKNDDVITVKKADFQLILMHPKDLSFFKTLRQKLLWGKDKRN